MKKQNAPHRLNAINALSLPKLLLHQDGATWERAHTLPSDRPDDTAVAISSILVPLDGTPYAEHALPHALAIARRSNAVLRLVHVHSRLDQIEPWQMYYSHESDDRRLRAKQEYLLDVAERIAKVDSVTVETILIDSNDTEDSLLQSSVGADLVVMASRRRGAFRRLWSYSVADALRRRLQKPTLFVRGYSSPVDLTGDPIARHILIPLNGSASAERILSSATAIGRLEGAMLTLLNIQNDEWSRGTFEHTNPSGYLKGIARKVSKAVPVVAARVVTTDNAVRTAVASYAEQCRVDLIALAARSDGNWSDLLRGSIVDSLLRRTNLPILLLRPNLEYQREEVTTVFEECRSLERPLG